MKYHIRWVYWWESPHDRMRSQWLEGKTEALEIPDNTPDPDSVATKLAEEFFVKKRSREKARGTLYKVIKHFE